VKSLLLITLLIFPINAILSDESKAIELLEPLMPKLPSVPQVETKPVQKNLEKGKKEPIRKLRTATCLGYITLGNKKTLSGKLTLPEYLEFRHSSDGIVFKKKIHACEIKKFSINQYTAAKSGETPYGEFYEFRPSRFLIIDHSGISYNIIEMETILTRVVFESNKGIAVLFFIFGDEFNPTLGWKHSKEKTFKSRLSDSHPQSIHQMQLEANGAGKAGKP
jgi:hypothetical protein